VQGSVIDFERLTVVGTFSNAALLVRSGESTTLQLSEKGTVISAVANGVTWNTDSLFAQSGVKGATQRANSIDASVRATDETTPKDARGGIELQYIPAGPVGYLFSGKRDTSGTITNYYTAYYIGLAHFLYAVDVIALHLVKGQNGKGVARTASGNIGLETETPVNASDTTVVGIIGGLDVPNEPTLDIPSSGAQIYFKGGRLTERARGGTKRVMGVADDDSVSLAKLKRAIVENGVSSGTAATTDAALRKLGTGADDAAQGSQLDALFLQWRTLHDFIGAQFAAVAAGTYLLVPNNAFAVGATSSGRGLFWIDPADYAITGRTPQFRLQASVYVNNTSPGTVDFIVELYPHATLAGGAGVITETPGAAVHSGPTFSNPTLGNPYHDASADFTIASAAHYVAGVRTTANMAASSLVVVNASLQVHWV
jgi:hypothetical protein